MGAKRVVVVGGDGTVNEAANGLLSVGAGKEVELAVIPRGTGTDFVLDLRDPVEGRRGDRGRTRRRRARDRRGQGLLPSLGRLGEKRVLRQRRKRRHERRSGDAGELDVEGARRQGVVPLGDAGRLRPLAERRGLRGRRRRAPRGQHARRHRGQLRVARGRDAHDAERKAGRRRLRRPPHRGRDEARPRPDPAEDLPRNASPAPEGGGAPRRDGASRCRDPAPRRARRRAARDDARDLRGRAGRPPPARPRPRKRSSRVRCRRRWSGRARATEPSPRPS